MSFISLVLFLVGCGENENKDEDTSVEPSNTEAFSFQGMDFILQSAEGYEPVGSNIRLGFDSDSQTLSFNAGCNHHSGSFEMDENILVITGLGGTEMGCEQDLMVQDEWFVSFFTSSPTITHAGDTLTIELIDDNHETEDITLIFGDDEVVNPDQPITAGLWTIDTYIEDDIASAYNLSVSPSLLFTDDGTIDVNTGCNNANGTYSIEGDQLTIAVEAITDAFCEGDLGDIEGHILQVLNGTIDFSIDASRLFLDNQGLGISGAL